MSGGSLYWARIKSRFGAFAAWVDGKGRLVRFDLRWRSGPVAEPGAIEDEKALCDIQRQIAEYENGARRVFDVECAARGTAFQHIVWNALCDIPFGQTTSYGALAKKLGAPHGARAVGLANGANPIGLIVPCHRVIGANGSLTGYGGGLPLKRALLNHEAGIIGMPTDLFA